MSMTMDLLAVPVLHKLYFPAGSVTTNIACELIRNPVYMKPADQTNPGSCKRTS